MINNHQTDPLLEAVQRLAKDRAVRFEQTDDDGVSRIVRATAPPLLLELREAIAGNITAHPGASMKAKMPINAGALDLLNEITAELDRWCAARRATNRYPRAEQPPAEVKLTAWYRAIVDARTRGRVSAEQEADYLRTLGGWERRILDMFNPPRVIELTRPCPVCGQRWTVDSNQDARVGTLIAEYRVAHGDAVEDIVARCRSCDARWDGLLGVRALNWELDTADPTTDEPAGVSKLLSTGPTP